MSETLAILTADELTRALSQLDVQWSSIPGRGLVRVVPMKNFTDGFALVAKIAGLADQLNHHPELTLRYDAVELTLTTHAVDGVTHADLRLAKEIDDLL
ncbi:MAG TPA: 4a-hydroxytetrahydrobiopterin dehydratase [Candidatus Saccharimonadales bacterium]|jgi:4a-hydroxytetrahydrobiopterin dehydratase|nr:4a-hydroxytetrahydrobiopterin dehydratase [Candidatus Saccharimonadales bacterium]